MTVLIMVAVCALSVRCGAQTWVPLFDGKSLDGWQPSEDKATWKVIDGCLVSGGGRSHLFYEGPVNNHEFKNFELKADVKTGNGANSGIYIHTHYQEKDFPETGYECQVINSYPPGRYIERKMTASIYAIHNVWKAPVPDNEWFHYHIIVQGKTIQTYINDELMAEYTESENPFRPKDKKGRLLHGGTFALQGHDPKSSVAVKNIEVKVLPDDLPSLGKPLDDPDFEAKIIQYSDDNFPLLDLDVQLKNGLERDAALANARKYGYTYGIVFDSKIPSDYHPAMQAFTGIKVFNVDQLRNLTLRNSMERYDYVIGALGLSKKANEVGAADADLFMGKRIASIEEFAATGFMQILAGATTLPDKLKADYDKLWTEERMDRVIKALLAGNVAMEINDRLKEPSAAFIKRAKKAGVKFAFGSGNTGPNDLGRLSYCIEMISECQLRPEDFWFPFLKTEDK
ncbi:MAG TPA: family 16 glycoside hydrolase [Verrucomicrobiae bacterium]